MPPMKPPRLIIVKSPENRVEKALPRPSDGAPVIRLHASGTQLDLSGDKVTDQLLDSMLAQSIAGKVRLIDNHKETFPVGWSFGGEIVEKSEQRYLDPDTGEEQVEPASRELYVDFWLDRDHPLVPIILKYIDAGWEPQCSIGLLENGGANRVERYDTAEGRRVGFLLDAPFDHLAFTPPGGAAYGPAGVEGVIAKSLAEAASMLKSTDPSRPSQEHVMQKEELAAKLKEAETSRPTRKAAYSACKDDAMQMAKDAGAHAAEVAGMAKEVLEMEQLTPEDMKAFLQHLMMENTVMAEALNELSAGGGEAPPEAELKTEGAVPEPAAAPAAPAKTDEPAKEAASPPSTAGTMPDRPGVPADAHPAPDAGTPTPTATEAVKKDDMGGVQMEIGKIQKSLSEVIEKQRKTIDTLESRLMAVEKQANFAAAPLRFMPGDGVTDSQAAENAAAGFASLDPAQKDTASRKALADGLRTAFAPMVRKLS